MLQFLQYLLYIPFGCVNGEVFHGFEWLALINMQQANIIDQFKTKDTIKDTINHENHCKVLLKNEPSCPWS